MGRRAVRAASWPQRSCAAFLLLRSVLLRTRADDSHIGLPHKKNEIDPGMQRPDGPWQGSEWCCSKPAASDSQGRRGTNTGDLRRSTSWFPRVPCPQNHQLARKVRKISARAQPRQMARETSEHGVGPSNGEGGEKRLRNWGDNGGVKWRGRKW